MASRQSVSSILKPPKVRAPLKEIESVDQDSDENTASLSKRKVSFSGMNKIKMYNTGATSLTVHQAPMFDEQISILSDSSNAEKHKLSGKFEKSDAQISMESTNCTNLEDNGRIIIEYESPNDNMEMTEALSGKIFSDTIYTIDKNGSEHISYSSDYSVNNMEFTEALKIGQILSEENSCDLSSTIMSETLVDESENEQLSQFGLKPSTSLSDVFIKNTSNINSSSSCMEFTCANQNKSNPINILCSTQSSNMELTCMAPKPVCLNDDYKSFSMELTQLPDRQTFENNCELVYEYSEHSMSIGSDISCEIQENKNDESEIVQTEKSEKNNSHYNISSEQLTYKSDNEEDLVEELSLSMVSMDIDSIVEGNEFDISYVNVDNPQIVANEQKHSMTAKIENSDYPVKSVLNNYSNVNDISNQNSESGISIFPTDSSFVCNMSPENNINKSVKVEDLLQYTLHSNTSVLDQNQYLEKEKSIIVENNPPKKYSRKTMMIHKSPLIVQENTYENEVEDNQKKSYSRKSVAPAYVFNEDESDTSEILEEQQQEMCSMQPINISVLNQKSFVTEDVSNTSEYNPSLSFEKEDTSVYNPAPNSDVENTSVKVEEYQPKIYSRKSIAPTSVLNEDVSDSSEIFEEIQQQRSSIKSISMSVLNQKSFGTEDVTNTSVFNPTLSFEKKDTSVYNPTQNAEEENTSVKVEEYQPKIYSRKSFAPTSVLNEDVSDSSEIFEEIQQQRSSIKSISMSVLNQKSFGTEDVSNTSVFNPTLSFEKKDTSVYNTTQNAEVENTSVKVEEYQPKIYSRKSVAPTSVLNEDVSDSSEIFEEIQQQRSSIQSIAMSVLNQKSLGTEDVSNTSVPVEDYPPKKYSRKSVGPTSLAFTHSESLDDSMSNMSLNSEESNEPGKAMISVAPVSVNNLSILQSDVFSHCENKLTVKDKHQSVLLNMIGDDDDLNSPFRKKTKKSIDSTHLTKPSVEEPCINNELGSIDDYISEKFENGSKMDISITHESKNDNEIVFSSEISGISKEQKELQTNKGNLVTTPNELKINRINVKELVTGNEFLVKTQEKTNNDSINITVTDDIKATDCILNSNNHSPSCSKDRTLKSICVKDVSNILTDEIILNNEKLCLINRKRSYSNRDGAPLSCSSFMSKPNIHQNMDEDFITDDFIKQSPIVNDCTNRSSTNELQISLFKEESIKEHLCNEVLEFLTRWNELFIEKILVLEKCTNREWIFNVLDSNIILTISYSTISDNNSFLKVDDISLTINQAINTITQNEIIKFGISWILTKYNPTVYKQICSSSRDIELLLKSLLEDVDFINKVMINMRFVRNVYCVTFKDNKAEFVIHNMNGPLMIRVEIALSNIHKLSFKDVLVECLFGDFNTKLLEKIMEDLTKDYKVLQSLVEKLRELYSHKRNLPFAKLF